MCLEWEETWSGGNDDFGYGVAIDSFDNIYIVGKTGTLGDWDMVLAKYNSSGVQQWNRTWGGDQDDLGCGLVIDSSDNIYIVGRTSSFGAGNKDIVLVKYNSLGELQWYKTWGGSGNDYGGGIAVDSSDNIYIVGITSSIGMGSYDIVLVKYSSSGVQEWNKIYGGVNTYIGEGIAIDSSDNIYIIGYTQSTGEEQRDVVFVKYSSLGVKEWNKTWGGSNDEYGYGVAVDSSDNIYIVESTGVSSTGDYCIILVKYNNAGNHEWNKTWGGIHYDEGYGVKVDSSDNVYVVGSTCSFGAPGSNMVLIKFNGSGVQEWFKTWGESDWETGYGVAIDSSDNIYVVGTTQDQDDYWNYLFLLKFSIDTDEDGLTDDGEVNIYSTDPNDSDSDDDGLSDYEEVITYSTDPNDSDSDDDGLSDYEEVITYSTDPNDSDSDDDGYTDGEEITGGFDPNNSEINPGIVNMIITVIVIFSIVAGIGYAVVKVSKKKRVKDEKYYTSIREEEGQVDLKNILRGMAKTKGEIDLKYLSKQMNKDIEKLRLFVYDLVGSSSLDGKMEGNKFIFSETSDIDSTIDTLLSTYADWEKQDKGKL